MNRDQITDGSDESVVALNYCAHAIEDLKHLSAHTHPAFVQSRRAINAVVELLQHSVKFILPNCCMLLDVDSFSQAHLDLLRLPYPVVAFEIPWKTDTTIDTLGGIKQVTASRRIALCWEPEATPTALRDAGLNTILKRSPQGGVFVLPVSWFDDHSLWTVGLGGSFIPYDNNFRPIDDGRTHRLAQRSYEALKEAGLVGKKVQKFDSEPFIIQPEHFDGMFKHNIDEGFFSISSDSRDEALALIQACAVLNCENVETVEIAANPKLNKARLAKGKQPFFSYKVLTLSADRQGNRLSEAGSLGGTHASPRMHLHPRDETLRGDTLYANVGPDGIIVFEKHPDPALGRLPVLHGPAWAVQKTIRRWASLHHDGVTYYLPSVSRASGQVEAVDALAWWRKFLSDRMPVAP